ncbi:EAL domain-containing protein [Devosia pacifica]|nr:EAL domain-containing protein [Devosia pacifica]
MVYIFMGVAALAAGATGYFGLGLTLAEAILMVVVVGSAAVVAQERVLRQRAERRLENSLEDLRNLLSTDAQAADVLGQRVNALAREDAGRRLDVVEADVSILGTVIRQVAEAVAEIEEKQAQPQPAPMQPEPIVEEPVRPRFSTAAIRRALEEDRIVHHLRPVMRLPQRRTYGYDLVARLVEDDGTVHEQAVFMPEDAGADLFRQIEAAGILESITLARRALATEQPPRLFAPFSCASLTDTRTVEKTVALLEANRAVSRYLTLRTPFADWIAMNSAQRAAAGQLVRTGVTFSLEQADNLRGAIGAMAADGVQSLRVDANIFLADPQHYTDFHTADIVKYLSRFDVELIATDISAENQLLELLEDGIALASGDHLSPAAPAWAQFLSDRPQATQRLRRVET